MDYIPLLFLPCLSLCQQTKAIKQSSNQQKQANKQAFKKQANALIFITSLTKSLYKLLLLQALSVSHYSFDLHYDLCTVSSIPFNPAFNQVSQSVLLCLTIQYIGQTKVNRPWILLEESTVYRSSIQKRMTYSSIVTVATTLLSLNYYIIYYITIPLYSHKENSTASSFCQSHHHHYQEQQKQQQQKQQQNSPPPSSSEHRHHNDTIDKDTDEKNIGHHGSQRSSRYRCRFSLFYTNWYLVNLFCFCCCCCCCCFPNQIESFAFPFHPLTTTTTTTIPARLYTICSGSLHQIVHGKTSNTLLGRKRIINLIMSDRLPSNRHWTQHAQYHCHNNGQEDLESGDKRHKGQEEDDVLDNSIYGYEDMLQVQPSLSSLHSFGSSTTARRRTRRKTKNDKVDESHFHGGDYDDGHGGGYYAPSSSGSSSLSSTQLWMNAQRGVSMDDKEESSSPSRRTRGAGKRRRGALKAVSSILSSFSPLYMLSNRGLQSSLEQNGGDSDEEEKEELLDKVNGEMNVMGAAVAKNVNVKKQLSMLQQENDILRKQVTQLYQENQRLHQSHHRQRIILEQFEGEGKPMLDVHGDLIDSMWWEKNGYNNDHYENETMVMTTTTDDYDGGLKVASSKAKKQSLQQQQQQEQEECTTQNINDGTCPIEPDISFRAALKDRAYWLVGLLTLQSMSGFILARNEELLQTHPVIVYFLTMLVGAGGNAGNQAAVRVIRGIALGTLNERTQRQFLQRELKMAMSLSVILSLAGFIRAVAFGTPFPETFAVTSALAIIVFTSICFGAVLPLILRKVDVDPAHSSTTIQVIMDILGVVLTVAVSTTILDSPVGQVIINKLTGGGGRS